MSRTFVSYLVQDKLQSAKQNETKSQRRKGKQPQKQKQIAPLAAKQVQQSASQVHTEDEVNSDSPPSSSPPSSMSEGNGTPELQHSMDQNQMYFACKMIDNRIEKFTGTEQKTFEEFLEEYTDLIQRFAIPHEVAKNFLPLYLAEGAKLKYQQIPGHEKLSWKDLVNELAKRLRSQALLSNLRDELHNLSQGRDSVGEFAKQVYFKTKMAFQVQGDRIISRMAIDFSVRGLNPDIRKAIRRLPVTAQRRPPTPFQSKTGNRFKGNNTGRQRNWNNFTLRLIPSASRNRGALPRFRPFGSNQRRVRFAPQPTINCSCKRP
ncbi:hypothetical protein Y032_0029g1885 [Ancylostoma ceylanicum]|uniref:Retrotransposon gag domain-containing protein n=1 Tax=Ancylostoma ceylanicum TaxID=53326 RepID=A0A016USA2_9BILA|nr:hypothetical protein Y032_0029g1885 [Ancylostoma ceylanicum]